MIQLGPIVIRTCQGKFNFLYTMPQLREKEKAVFQEVGLYFEYNIYLGNE